MSEVGESPTSFFSFNENRYKVYYSDLGDEVFKFRAESLKYHSPAQKGWGLKWIQFF
ncbi:hypothetical protein LV84_00551 [Algoriphagus ratkowskyi]|uniref:Uncharacterized protein n=1 Tax=Algoriphagus ratkowskyi TaxID=57028 RepID=A0A2W7S0C0_9BACT|nr:hypothetical protein LV84_00551 [Algoriphagus ratkowskyi]